MKGIFDFIFGNQDNIDDPYADVLQLDEEYLENERSHERNVRSGNFSGIEDTYGIASFNNTCFFYVLSFNSDSHTTEYN